MRHDAQQRAWACGDTARCTECGTARDMAYYTAGARCDTVERKATIRPGEACDTAPGVPRQSRPSAQPRPWVCAHCALDSVLTQCTVSESLFGTLFMNTVHEHYSRGFRKNKIK